MNEPVVVAAIISAITTIIMFILSSIVKSVFERRFHAFKLKSDHNYELRKQIKNSLAKNKIMLLNISESLNHRLWNFMENEDGNWHAVNGDYNNCKQRYFISFVYRILSFFSWIRKIENEMIYLDTTISTNEDLILIKYLRTFPQLFCDAHILPKIYNRNVASDHFFRNEFEKMVDSMFHDGNIIDNYEKFCSTLGQIGNQIISIQKWIDGINRLEKRYRWDILKIFHLLLMCFINSFGYDFQYSDNSKLKKVLHNPRKPNKEIIDNFVPILKRMKLNNDKEIKNLLKLIA